MLALLKHDLRVMRFYLCILVMIVCFYAGLLHFSKLLVTTTSMAVILSLYSGFLESLLSVERKCYWDRYVLTMPISREIVVRERYCLMLLVAFLPCLVGMCIDGLLYGGAHFFVYLVLLAFCGLLLSFIAPIYLKKVSTGKSALAMTLLVVLCGLAAGGLSMQEAWVAWRWPVLALLSVVTIVALLVSYHISLWIYQDKEF